MALAAAVAVSAGGLSAAAQQTRQTRQNPGNPTRASQPASTPANQAGAPGQPAKRPARVQEPGPYVTLSSAKQWNMDVRLRVMSDRPDRFDGNGMPVITPFEFKTTALVFPLIEGSASHTLDSRRVVSELRVDGNSVLANPPGQTELVGGSFHSGTKLMKLAYTSPSGETASARMVQAMFTMPVTCAKTQFDEKAAMSVGWPAGEWPEAAKSTLQPQMFIDSDGSGPYDTTDVELAIRRWLTAQKVNDAKAVPPVRLAKIIAGGVWGDIQPSGEGLSFARTGEFEGFVFRTPAQVLRDKRGSEPEVVALLVLALRKAGLPARVVVGYEAAAGGERGKNFLDKNRGGRSIRMWAEFALYDEPNNTLNWVPIDVLMMRKTSSRAPSPDRDWRYFGTHDQLDAIVPFAFGFHPPMPGVRAYTVPAFYGWVMTPTSPDKAYQMLSFSVARASTSPSKERERAREKEEDRKPEVKRGR